VQTPEERAEVSEREPMSFVSDAARGVSHSNINPNNPPWGVGIALLVFIASLVLMFVVQIFILLPYVLIRGTSAMDAQTTIFLATLALLPAHLLTILIVWAVVSGFGQRPFWETLGWSWGRYFGLWRSLAIGVLLFVASAALARFLGGEKPTPLEMWLNSSAATRYTIAFLATLTAPFVEESVFRGVLYSALHKTIGAVGAVVIVATLFTGVHVAQYRTNIGVIAAVGVLSLGLTIIRAVSGKLLPCYIVHLVFNGIQSVIIMLEPMGKAPLTNPDHAPALIFTLIPRITSLF
jgi:uncharacterized protein